MAELKLVIFDCDGVMFDSKHANRVYYNHLLQNFGHPPMTEDEVEYVHVHHVLDSIKHIFRHYPAELEMAEAYRKTVDYTPYLQYMIMEPDLLDFLAFLRPGRKTAISTNRTTTMPAVLDIFKLRHLFDKVVTALDVGQPKPHPEALHLLLDYFGMSVENTVYIGDSMVDRQHTAGVGMRMIAYKNPGLPAEYHVTKFMEVTGLPIF